MGLSTPADGLAVDDWQATPALSAVMPVFNADRFVAEAVSSVLDQTFRDFELIAIDDGSTDGSRAILESFAAQDSRIVLVAREHRGIARTRQEGLELARARLVASMDADDVSRRARFERQVRYMEAHPECVLLGASVVHVDPYGNPLREERLPEKHEEIDRRLLRGMGGAIRQPAAMFRKPAALSVGGYAEEYSGTEDLDLFLRLAEVGRVANLSEVLLDYRQHLASTNRTRWRLQDEHRRLIVEAAYRRRGLAVPSSLDLEPYVVQPAAVQLREWALTLLHAGRRTQARRHAWRAVLESPVSRAAWSLLARTFG